MPVRRIYKVGLREEDWYTLRSHFPSGETEQTKLPCLYILGIQVQRRSDGDLLFQGGRIEDDEECFRSISEVLGVPIIHELSLKDPSATELKSLIVDGILPTLSPEKQEEVKDIIWNTGSPIGPWRQRQKTNS